MIAFLSVQAAPQQGLHNAAALPVQLSDAAVAAPGMAHPQQPALAPLMPLQGTAGVFVLSIEILPLTGRRYEHFLGPRQDTHEILQTRGGDTCVFCHATECLAPRLKAMTPLRPTFWLRAVVPPSLNGCIGMQ